MFCIDVLKPGGSFVCKFYQGPDDRLLRNRLDAVFEKVYQEKPEASRPVCSFPASSSAIGEFTYSSTCVYIKGGCVGIEGELFHRVEEEGQSGQGGNRENALDGVGTRGYSNGN